MEFEDVKKRFERFKNKYGKGAYKKIDSFLESIKEEYLTEKTNKLFKSGLKKLDSHNKARQAWKTFVGGSLERLLFLMIEQMLKGKYVNILSDKSLKSDCLDEEKDLVRRISKNYLVI